MSMGNQTILHSEWLTASEAAQYLKVKVRTLLLWVRQGKVKAFALSGTKRRVCCQQPDSKVCHLPLLYSNTVLQGESRKLLRLVVKKLVSPVTSVTGGEGGIRTLGTKFNHATAQKRLRPVPSTSLRSTASSGSPPPICERSFHWPAVPSCARSPRNEICGERDGHLFSSTFRLSHASSDPFPQKLSLEFCNRA